MTIKIAPSILSCDFSRLQEQIDEIKNADLIHVDVMDGHFVPNITIGPVIVKTITSDLPLDVHLMIENPEKYIDAFAKAGAGIITVHAQVCKDNLKEVIAQIKAAGCKASVALNPDKGLELIADVLDELDMVLLMTVFPGFGGQKFITDVIPKIQELRKMKPDLDIEVDGGINKDTIQDAVNAGANVIVAGTAVYGTDNPAEAIDELRANSTK